MGQRPGRTLRWRLGWLASPQSPDWRLPSPLDAGPARPDRLVAGVADVRRMLVEGWTELGPGGRRLLVGLVTAAALLMLVQPGTGNTEREVAEAEGRGLHATVRALEPLLPDLASRASLSGPELAAVDRLLGHVLIGTGRVRVKLWSLDGTILYSDARDLIGRTYPDVRPRLAEAAAAGIYTERNAAEPENLLERDSGPLTEHYIAVHQPVGGPPVAVLETYGPLPATIGAASALELAHHAGLLLVTSLLAGVALSSARRSLRRRQVRRELASRFEQLASVTQSAVAAVDPVTVLGRLRPALLRELRLDSVELAETGSSIPPRAAIVRLENGRLLVAQRRERLTRAEIEVLASAGEALDLAAHDAARMGDLHGAVADRATLVDRILHARTEERRRLVAELHDLLAATLVRTLFAVRRAEAALGPRGGAAVAAIEAAEHLVETAEAQLRNFMAEADIPMDRGSDLRSAITAAVDQFAAETGMKTAARTRGDLGRVSAASQAVLLGALREALLNVERHARAASVRIDLCVGPDRVRLAVIDDGVGWPASVRREPGRGLGIAQLEERLQAMGGELCRRVGRRGGARLVVGLPCAPQVP